MTITVTAVNADIPLKRSNVHARSLHDDIKGKLGDKFHGVTVRDGQWAIAHVPTTLDPKLETDIKAALAGYERRLGGDYSREGDLAHIRSTYSPEVADVIASGKYVDYVNALVASIVGPLSPDEPLDKRLARIQAAISDSRVLAIRRAYAEFTARQNPPDIRAVLLGELRAKFGDKIKDLALIHGDATVTVTGDYDATHIDTIHETVEKHDKSKTPPEPPDPQVLLIQTIQKMEAQIVALTKRLDQLEGKKAAKNG